VPTWRRLFERAMEHLTLQYTCKRRPDAAHTQQPLRCAGLALDLVSISSSTSRSISFTSQNRRHSRSISLFFQFSFPPEAFIRRHVRSQDRSEANRPSCSRADKVARKYINTFGIATECGMARAPTSGPIGSRRSPRSRALCGSDSPR
jgi:hypothetical protein